MPQEPTTRQAILVTLLGEKSTMIVDTDENGAETLHSSHLPDPYLMDSQPAEGPFVIKQTNEIYLETL